MSGLGRPAVRGTNLRSLLHERGPLTPVQAALFVAALADELAAVHGRGASFGVLAPETVGVEFRARRPCPVLPTPGQAGGPAADVHAAGLLLAELMGADRPGGPPPPGVPDAVWAVVRDCLAVEPAERPGTAQLAHRLRLCARDVLLGRRPAPSRPVTPRRGGPAPRYVPGPPTRDPSTDPPRRRGRALVAATTTLAIIIAAVGIGFAVTGQGSPSSAAQRTSHTTPAPTTTTTTTAPESTTTVATPTATKVPEPPPQTQTQEPPRTETETVTTAPPAPPETEPEKPETKAPPQQPTSVCAPTSGDCAAQASFAAYGEHLYVCDKKADGHGAMVSYRRSDVPGQNNEAWASSGNGTCFDQNMNMPEGATITFKVCLADHQPRKILSCSGTITNSS
jgi:hypothetical protein